MLLRISLLEFILRIVPESFLSVLAIYLLNYKRINCQKYIVSSVFLALSVYLVRMLPINFGVHTIINIIILILITVSINKINTTKAISSVLKVIIAISICESINIVVLDKVMKFDLQIILNEPLSKMLYSAPSMVMFGIVILLFYKYKFKTRIELSNVCN